MTTSYDTNLASTVQRTELAHMLLIRGACGLITRRPFPLNPQNWDLYIDGELAPEIAAHAVFDLYDRGYMRWLPDSPHGHFACPTEDGDALLKQWDFQVMSDDGQQVRAPGVAL